MVRKVFKLMTATQIASAVTVSLCLFIDSIIIGRLVGVDAMSAYGLANPVLIMLAAQATMLATGVQVKTGEAMGSGDLKACSRVFSTSAAVALLLALAWMIVVFAAGTPLCTLLGAGSPSADDPVFTMTSDYLRGYMLGAPFLFLNQIMVPYLQSMGKRKLTMVSVIVMTVTDIVLDLLSVYVFHAGMLGIGLASSTSYLASFLVGAGCFLSRDCLFKFDRNAISAGMSLSIWRSGSPVMINQFCFTLRVYVINQLLLRASGTVAVAAFSAISTMGNIIFSVGLGAGSVTLLLASIFHVEEDRSSLYELMRGVIPYSLRMIVAAVACVEIAAPLLVRLFLGRSPDVLSIAVPGLRLYFISLIPVVLSTVVKNYYQGTGRMKFTNLISACDNVLLLLPFTILFYKLFGLTGVWTGIVVGQFSVLLMISAVVWIRNGSITFTPEAYCMLDDGFGADPSEVFEMSVTDMDSAIGVSEAISRFCREKGFGNRLSMLVSLCVEEIVVNIIDHGFSKDDRAHQADVRLVADGPKCVIRVRDNCISFDPTSYLELHQTGDPAAHIGIRIVTGMVDEISYINSLGLNNLHMIISSR